jgi:hypothetical protein
MECCDNLRARILAPPSPQELARRKRLIEAIRGERTSITPLTVTDLRRIAREQEEATYGHSDSVGA